MTTLSISRLGTALAAAALAATLATPAQAAVHFLSGPNGPSGQEVKLDDGDWVIAASLPRKGTFSHEYLFATDGPSNNHGSAGSFSFHVFGKPIVDIMDFSLTFVGNGLQKTLIGDKDGSFLSHFDFNSNGSFKLIAAGNAIGKAGGDYGFKFQVAAVPEPSEWAMMLAGLGAVGWVASRRRRQDTAIAAAA